jgi:hypothetical protein
MAEVAKSDLVQNNPVLEVVDRNDASGDFQFAIMHTILLLQLNLRTHFDFSIFGRETERAITILVLSSHKTHCSLQEKYTKTDIH